MNPRVPDRRGRDRRLHEARPHRDRRHRRTQRGHPAQGLCAIHADADDDDEQQDGGDDQVHVELGARHDDLVLPTRWATCAMRWRRRRRRRDAGRAPGALLHQHAARRPAREGADRLVPVGRLRLRRQLPAQGHQGAVGTRRGLWPVDAAARRRDRDQPRTTEADDRAAGAPLPVAAGPEGGGARPRVQGRHRRHPRVARHPHHQAAARARRAGHGPRPDLQRRGTRRAGPRRWVSRARSTQPWPACRRCCW